MDKTNRENDRLIDFFREEYSKFFLLRPLGNDGGALPPDLKGVLQSIIGQGRIVSHKATEVSKMPQDTAGAIYKDLTPKAIKAYLDRYVIGQEDAKRALAVVANNHLKRMAHPEKSRLIGKSNLLMIGDTGVGKTYLVQRLSEVMNVPFTIEDSSQITKPMYVGRSPVDILETLLQRANGDLKKAQYGIVFLDELDKLAHKTDGTLNASVGTKGVQDSLLKMVEGAEYEIRTPVGVVTFNTANVLFIAGGAFAGIDKIVEKNRNKRDASKGSIGFGAAVSKKQTVTKEDSHQMVNVEDLVSYGITPEMCGRLHHITRLHALDRDSLIQIMKEADDSLVKRYQTRMELDGIELSFTHQALEEIADRCIEYKTGARGLVSMLEYVLSEAQFEMPGGSETELKINKKYAAEKLKQMIV